MAAIASCVVALLALLLFSHVEPGHAVGSEVDDDVVQRCLHAMEPALQRCTPDRSTVQERLITGHLLHLGLASCIAGDALNDSVVLAVPSSYAPGIQASFDAMSALARQQSIDLAEPLFDAHVHAYDAASALPSRQHRAQPIGHSSAASRDEHHDDVDAEDDDGDVLTDSAAAACHGSLACLYTWEGGLGLGATVAIGARHYHADAVAVAASGPLYGATWQPLDLEGLVAMDTFLSWQDVLAPIRERLGANVDSVAALPLGSSTLLLLVRQDVLAATGANIPATWDALLAWAEAYSTWAASAGSTAAQEAASGAAGVAPPQYPLCIPPGPGNDAGDLLAAIWYSYTQTEGAQQGVHFDPDTMHPQLANEAFAAAARIFARLLALAAPLPGGVAGDGGDAAGATTAGAHAAPGGLSTGLCAMALGPFELVKDVALLPRNASGRWPLASTAFQAARLPGSLAVLDRSTGRLRHCTHDACPLAEDCSGFSAGCATQQQQQAVLNRVPYVPASSLVASVSASVAPELQLLAYHLISSLAQPGASLQALVAPGSNYGPFRYSHFDQSNGNLWVAAGYDLGLIGLALDLMAADMAHPNLGFGLQLTGARHLSSELVAAALALPPTTSSPANSSQPGAMAADPGLAQLASLEQHLAARYVPQLLLSQYRNFLGYPAQQLLPPSLAPRPNSGDESTVSSQGHGVPATVLVGVLGVVGVLVVTVAGFLTWYVSRRTCMRRRGSLARLSWRSNAPGVGSLTTLLVTDIQDSTALWEELDPRVMDAACHVHHDCLRRLLVKHRGYESATEGDSFILAFSTPHNALAFALEAQAELLRQDWPAELLDTELCSPVHTCLPSGFPFKRMAAPAEPAAPALPGSAHPALGNGSGNSTPRGPGPASARRASVDLGHMAKSLLTAAFSRNLEGQGTGQEAGFSGRGGGAQALPYYTASGYGSGRVGLPHARLSMDVLSTTATASGGPYAMRGGGSAAGGGSDGGADAADATPRGQVQVQVQQQHVMPPAAERGSRQAGHPPLSHFNSSQCVPSMQRMGTELARMGTTGHSASTPSNVLLPADTGGSGHAVDTSGVDHYESSDAFAEWPMQLPMQWQQPLHQQQQQPHPHQASPHVETLSPTRGFARGSGPDAPPPTMTRSAASVLRCATAGASAGDPPVSGSGTARAGWLLREGAALFMERLQQGDGEAGAGAGSGLPPVAGEVATSPESPSLRGPTTTGPGLWAAAAAAQGQHPADLCSPTVRTFGAMARAQQREADSLLCASGAAAQERRRRLMFRGLRVRMGLHSGVHQHCEVDHNLASARTVYRGDAAQQAREVSDAAQGGMVLLSQACEQALVRGADGNAATVLIPSTASSVISDSWVVQAGYYRLKRGGPPRPLFIAVSNELAPRLVLLPPPRSVTPVGLPLYDAPVGRVALAVLAVPDVAALSAWDGAATRQALGVLEGVLLEQLAQHNGFLASWETGHFVAAFGCPLAATRFCLSLMEALLQADWPAALLAHELCDERCVQVHAGGIEGMSPSRHGTLSPPALAHSQSAASFGSPAVPAAAARGAAAAPSQRTMRAASLLMSPHCTPRCLDSVPTPGSVSSMMVQPAPALTACCSTPAASTNGMIPVGSLGANALSARGPGMLPGLESGSLRPLERVRILDPKGSTSGLDPRGEGESSHMGTRDLESVRTESSALLQHHSDAVTAMAVLGTASCSSMAAMAPAAPAAPAPPMSCAPSPPPPAPPAAAPPLTGVSLAHQSAFYQVAQVTKPATPMSPFSSPGGAPVHASGAKSTAAAAAAGYVASPERGPYVKGWSSKLLPLHGLATLLPPQQAHPVRSATHGGTPDGGGGAPPWHPINPVAAAATAPGMQGVPPLAQLSSMQGHPRNPQGLHAHYSHDNNACYSQGSAVSLRHASSLLGSIPQNLSRQRSSAAAAAAAAAASSQPAPDANSGGGTCSSSAVPSATGMLPMAHDAVLQQGQGQGRSAPLAVPGAGGAYGSMPGCAGVAGTSLEIEPEAGAEATGHHALVQEFVLMRGLRLKVGLDYGPVEWSISGPQRALSYSGAPALQASRLAAWGTAGQVLVTQGSMREIAATQARQAMNAMNQLQAGASVDTASGSAGGSAPQVASPLQLLLGPAVMGQALRPPGRVSKEKVVYLCRFTDDWDVVLRGNSAAPGVVAAATAGAPARATTFSAYLSPALSAPPNSLAGGLFGGRPSMSGAGKLAAALSFGMLRWTRRRSSTATINSELASDPPVSFELTSTPHWYAACGHGQSFGGHGGNGLQSSPLPGCGSGRSSMPAGSGMGLGFASAMQYGAAAAGGDARSSMPSAMMQPWALHRTAPNALQLGAEYSSACFGMSPAFATASCTGMVAAMPQPLPSHTFSPQRFGGSKSGSFAAAASGGHYSAHQQQVAVTSSCLLLDRSGDAASGAGPITPYSSASQVGVQLQRYGSASRAALTSAARASAEGHAAVPTVWAPHEQLVAPLGQQHAMRAAMAGCGGMPGAPRKLEDAAASLSNGMQAPFGVAYCAAAGGGRHQLATGSGEYESGDETLVPGYGFSCSYSGRASAGLQAGAGAPAGLRLHGSSGGSSAAAGNGSAQPHASSTPPQVIPSWTYSAGALVPSWSSRRPTALGPVAEVTTGAAEEVGSNSYSNSNSLNVQHKGSRLPSSGPVSSSGGPGNRRLLGAAAAAHAVAGEGSADADASILLCHGLVSLPDDDASVDSCPLPDTAVGCSDEEQDEPAGQREDGLGHGRERKGVPAAHGRRQARTRPHSASTENSVFGGVEVSLNYNVMLAAGGALGQGQGVNSGHCLVRGVDASRLDALSSGADEFEGTFECRSRQQTCDSSDGHAIAAAAAGGGPVQRCHGSDQCSQSRPQSYVHAGRTHGGGGTMLGVRGAGGVWQAGNTGGGCTSRDSSMGMFAMRTSSSTVDPSAGCSLAGPPRYGRPCSVDVSGGTGSDGNVQGGTLAANHNILNLTFLGTTVSSGGSSNGSTLTLRTPLAGWRRGVQPQPASAAAAAAACAALASPFTMQVGTPISAGSSPPLTLSPQRGSCSTAVDSYRLTMSQLPDRSSDRLALTPGSPSVGISGVWQHRQLQQQQQSSSDSSAAP